MVYVVGVYHSNTNNINEYYTIVYIVPQLDKNILILSIYHIWTDGHAVQHLIIFFKRRRKRGFYIQVLQLLRVVGCRYRWRPSRNQGCQVCEQLALYINANICTYQIVLFPFSALRDMSAIEVKGQCGSGTFGMVYKGENLDCSLSHDAT